MQQGNPVSTAARMQALFSLSEFSARELAALHRQQEVLQRCQSGRANERDVLKVTTSSMKQCSWKGALQCLQNLENAGIAPDVITYSAVISACEKGGQTQMAAWMLRSAVHNGIYQAALGYDTYQNQLNVHVNSVYMSQAFYQHEPGIPASVAKTIFDHHWNAGNIQAGTRIIVGRHGDNLLKQPQFWISGVCVFAWRARTTETGRRGLFGERQ